MWQLLFPGEVMAVTLSWLIADEAYRKQREFVINGGADLELVKKEAGLYIYKLR